MGSVELNQSLVFRLVDIMLSIHRIVITISIRTHGVILLAQRIHGRETTDGRMVQPCGEVVHRKARIPLLAAELVRVDVRRSGKDRIMADEI